MPSGCLVLKCVSILMVIMLCQPAQSSDCFKINIDHPINLAEADIQCNLTIGPSSQYPSLSAAVQYLRNSSCTDSYLYFEPATYSSLNDTNVIFCGNQSLHFQTIEGSNGTATFRFSSSPVSVWIFENGTQVTFSNIDFASAGGPLQFATSILKFDKAYGHFYDVNFYDNNLNYGIHASNESYLYFENCTFTNNTFLSGCIFQTDTISILNGVTFTNNSAKEVESTYLVCKNQYAGPAITACEFSLVILENCTAESNIGSVGVFSIYYSEIVIEGGQYSSNMGKSAGVAYVQLGIANISDATFTSNKCDSLGGGVLYSLSSSLKVERSLFYNNKRVNESGAGAIYIEKNFLPGENGSSGPAIINECNFTSNVGAQGGAIWAQGASISVTNSQFLENCAGSGGALAVTGIDESLLQLYFENCVFLQNGIPCCRIGGALFIDCPANLTIVKTEFSGNRAAYYAGAFYGSTQNQAILHDTIIQHNVADIAGGIMFEGPVQMTYVTLENNMASTSSGGMLLSYTPTVEENAVISVMDSCTVRNNTVSSGPGGGITLKKDNQLQITNVTFSYNNASSAGGIAVDDSSVVWLTNVTFMHNIGKFGAAAVGAAKKTKIYLTHVIVTQNFGNTGGAFFVGDDSFFSADQLYCESNTGGDGAILAAKNKAQIQINNAVIVNNYARRGGLYFADESSGNVTNILIHKNIAVSQGAGALITDSSHPVFINCTFKDNHAYGGGGSMSIHTTANPIFTNCTFTHGVASSGGAGFLADLSNTTFISCTFSYNHANSEGGGLILSGYAGASLDMCVIEYNNASSIGAGIKATESAIIDIRNCTFDNNFSEYAGGALHFDDNSTAVIEKVRFTNNSARGPGGAVFAGINASPSFIGCLFENNKSNSSGGAVVVSAECNVLFTGCLFNLNTAVRGGAMVLTGRSNSTFNYCIFSNCSAGNAGCIAADSDSTARFDACRFLNCFSYSLGGAMILEESSYSLFNRCLFTNNTGFAAGAIYASTYRGPEISESYFHLNTATQGPGGAFVFKQSNRAYIMNTFISNCSAASDGGGAASLQDSVYIFLHNVTISNCSASYGGAISSQDKSNLTLDSVRISNCKATPNGLSSSGSGGALHIQGQCYCESFSSTVSNCIGETGGGIWSESVISKFTDLTVEGCNAFSGGALHLLYSIPINFLDQTGFPFHRSNFTGNNAKVYGGAVVLQVKSLRGKVESTPFVVFKSCVFKDNTANLGGAVVMFGTANVALFTDSIFYGCSAKLGGSVYLTYFDSTGNGNNTDIWMTNCSFTKSTATDAGSVGFIGPAPNAVDFCKNCSCDGISCSEYGLATYLYQIAPNISSGALQYVVNGYPFEYTVCAYDAFANIINGSFVKDNNITVQFFLSGDSCNLTSSQESYYIQSNGCTTAILNATGGKSCTLSFSALQHTFLQNQDQVKNSTTLTIQACNEGYVLNYKLKSCVLAQKPHRKGVWEIIVLFGTTVILSLICCTCILFVWYVRKRRARYSSLYKALRQGREVTRLDLFDDQNIRKIDWSEIAIVAQIGSGAMGVVYRGVWVHEGEQIDVALKRLHMSGLASQMQNEDAERFLFEVKLLSLLDHRNVVKFLGISFMSDMEAVLVTELMHYGSVSDILKLKNVHIGWKILLKLARDAARGISYLHARKVIHRDIKPANLLVNKNWQCKIADFGIATLRAPSTQEMTVVGTALYMAPEVVLREAYSEKADVFSFGMVLYYLYTRIRPFSEPEYRDFSPLQLTLQMANGDLRPSLDGIPAPLAQLLEDCWNGNPRLRPSMEEIRVRLRRLAEANLPDYGSASGSFHRPPTPLQEDYANSPMMNTPISDILQSKILKSKGQSDKTGTTKTGFQLISPDIQKLLEDDSSSEDESSTITTGNNTGETANPSVGSSKSSRSQRSTLESKESTQDDEQLWMAYQRRQRKVKNDEEEPLFNEEMSPKERKKGTESALMEKVIKSAGRVIAGLPKDRFQSAPPRFVQKQEDSGSDSESDTLSSSPLTTPSLILRQVGTKTKEGTNSENSTAELPLITEQLLINVEKSDFKTL